MPLVDVELHHLVAPPWSGVGHVDRHRERVAGRDDVEALYAPPRAGEVIRNGLASPVRSSPKQPVILAAGRLWDEAKNVAALAAVAPGLPWPVRIAGPLAAGNSRRDDRPLLRPSHVTWLGELSRGELLAEMQHATIFAAPAVYEPFGLTVLEAALAGCALVLADIASFRELWDGAALFVDPRDQAMLEAALARVARDEPLRRTLQRRAAFRAQRYSHDAMSDAYCALYQQMAGARPVARAAPGRTAIESRP